MFPNRPLLLHDLFPPLLRRHPVSWGRPALLWVAAVFVALVGLALLAGHAYGSVHSRPDVVQVQRGDTLWGIITAHYKDGEVRHHLDDVTSANGLAGGLTPGTTLILPAS